MFPKQFFPLNNKNTKSFISLALKIFSFFIYVCMDGMHVYIHIHMCVGACVCTHGEWVVCMYTHMFTCMWEHVCAYMQKSIVIVEIFFDHSSTLFFRTEFLSQTQNLQICLFSLISLFRDPLSLLSQAGITDRSPCSHSSYMGPGVLSSDLLAFEASLLNTEPSSQFPGFIFKNCA